MRCPCITVIATYWSLVGVEVVGEAAHVGGWRRPEVLRVEERGQRRPAPALRGDGQYVYKANIVDKRHCTVAQLCIILNNLRVSSVQITECRHSNVPAPAAGSSDFYTSLRRAFLGHFILPFAIYLLYCHKSPLRPMISRIVCGRQKVLCSCCLCVTQSVSYSAAVV